MELLNRAVASSLPYIPRALLGFFSRPYIAGESLDEALETVRALNELGCQATLDVLGEEVNDEERALAFTDQYLEALDRISEGGLGSNISVKLSALGLRLDVDLCESNLRRLVERASALGSFVRVDMEDATTTTDTLSIYRRLREDTADLGLVLQARLLRTPGDLAALLPLTPRVRLVKGIYLETPEIALQDPQAIREAYLSQLEALLGAGCSVAIATHDPLLIKRSLRLIDRFGVPRERYEFQMLLGVAHRLRRDLVASGHPLRVYVPFGGDWYAYSLRRLKENPQVAGHVLRNMLTLGRL